LILNSRAHCLPQIVLQVVRAVKINSNCRRTNGVLNISTLRRRTSLGLAVSQTPPDHRDMPGPNPSIDLLWNGRRAVFTLNGQARWVIDPVLFGGRPKLNVTTKP